MWSRAETLWDISGDRWHHRQHEFVWLLDLHVVGEDVGLNTTSEYGGEAFM